MKKKIFITRRIPESGVRLLDDDFQVEIHPANRAIERDELIRAIDDSHALVEVVYDLEPLLPEREDQKSALPPAVRAFTAKRYRTAVRFTASLFLTAWEMSAEVDLPDWLIRDSR